MQKGLTDIIFVLDNSGSMFRIKDEAIGSYNSFVEQQRKTDGLATLTVVLFDSTVKTVFEGVDIQEAPEMQYNPTGMTALYDSIGIAVRNAEVRHLTLAKEDRPEKVIVAIMTDGQENSSREFCLKSVNALISHMRSSHNWEFLFLGANQDAFAVGGSLGIQYAANFDASKKGYSAGGLAMSNTISLMRGIPLGESYLNKDQSKAIMDSLNMAMDTSAGERRSH